MNKHEFLAELRNGISCLPKEDIEERVAFYREMIEDRVEEGLSEEEAILQIGNVNEIAEHIVEDTPIAKIVKEKVTPKRELRAWEIVLIILGAPIWLSLLIALLAVAISVWAAIFSVIISLWAVSVSLIAMLFGGIAAGVIMIVKGALWQGIATIGAGLVCAGLGVLLFIGCIYAAKGTLWLTKKLITGIKKVFIRKEDDK